MTGKQINFPFIAFFSGGKRSIIADNHIKVHDMGGVFFWGGGRTVTPVLNFCPGFGWACRGLGWGSRWWESRGSGRSGGSGRSRGGNGRSGGSWGI